MKDEKVKRPTESIKVYKDVVDKVRTHIESSGQTITAFFSITADEKLKTTIKTK